MKLLTRIRSFFRPQQRPVTLGERRNFLRQGVAASATAALALSGLGLLSSCSIKNVEVAGSKNKGDKFVEISFADLTAIISDANPKVSDEICNPQNLLNDNRLGLNTNKTNQREPVLARAFAKRLVNVIYGPTPQNKRVFVTRIPSTPEKPAKWINIDDSQLD